VEFHLIESMRRSLVAVGSDGDFTVASVSAIRRIAWSRVPPEHIYIGAGGHRRRPPRPRNPSSGVVKAAILVAADDKNLVARLGRRGLLRTSNVAQHSVLLAELDMLLVLLHVYLPTMRGRGVSQNTHAYIPSVVDTHPIHFLERSAPGSPAGAAWSRRGVSCVSGKHPQKHCKCFWCKKKRFKKQSEIPLRVFAAADGALDRATQHAAGAGAAGGDAGTCLRRGLCGSRSVSALGVCTAFWACLPHTRRSPGDFEYAFRTCLPIA